MKLWDFKSQKAPGDLVRLLALFNDDQAYFAYVALLRAHTGLYESAGKYVSKSPKHAQLFADAFRGAPRFTPSPRRAKILLAALSVVRKKVKSEIPLPLSEYWPTLAEIRAELPELTRDDEPYVRRTLKDCGWPVRPDEHRGPRGRRKIAK